MKYLSIISIAVFLFACQPPKENNYVSISGKIMNQNSDSVRVYNKSYSKTIPVKTDGTFSDTLHILSGVYYFSDGTEATQIFLKNGYDISMSLDTEAFDESIKYEGIGAENNNFLAAKYLKEENLFDLDVEDYDSTSLQQKMEEIQSELNEYVDAQTELDTMVVSHAKKGIVANVKGYSEYLGELIALRENLPKGTPSPTFEGYENHAGGTTSLADLKGKYVYVDVWATWCGPCKAEIPYLKEVEKEYHDKNIAFVSISIDREKDHQKWVDMVNEKELGGIQLFADNDWDSKFVKDYYINGIPRFILIDPEGNIISPDAHRPSNPKLRETLNELL